MFTLKRFALFGLAGLAAFSMSCSDTDDSGSVSKPIVAKDANGSWYLSGGAVVESSNGIDSVSISLVDASSNKISAGVILPITIPTLGVETYDVAQAASTYRFNASILDNCPAGTTVTAYLQVTGYFKEGGSESAKSDAITFQCEGSGPPAQTGTFDGTPKNVELGGTGSKGSAADLDGSFGGKIVYTRAEISSQAIKDAIDAVYDGTSLYSTYAAAAAGKNGGVLAGTESEAVLYPITATELAAINSSQVPVATATALATTKFSAGADDFGAVSVGANFLAITSEGKTLLISVASKDGTIEAAFLVVSSTSQN